MKKLTTNEMSETTASGCGWMKRMARRAQRGGDGAGALSWGIQWGKCKKE